MDTTIQIIAQEVNTKTGEVIHRHAVYTKAAAFPKHIRDLGFNHEEQIEILKQSQESLLHAQQLRIDEHQSTCPHCGKRTTKQGKFTSDFHAVFTDHEVVIQRTRCQCGWRSKISIDGMYGSALHPDLVELQAKFGSETSFKKTEGLLTARCCGKRAINNHSRIQKTVQHVGELLLAVKKDKQWIHGAANDPGTSKELVLVIDGAHLHSKDKHRRSFEAMTATVYNPKNHIEKDKQHNEITNKTVVASAKSDRQKNIKRLAKNACLKQGMDKKTTLTVLTDGAKNCWSVVASLENECLEMITVLDWFHIGMKFKNRQHVVPNELKEDYEKAKWCLWHGDSNKSLLKLKEIKSKLIEGKEKMGSLITYIKNNQSHLAHYKEREKAGLVFTSQLAESTVNNLVNERQKHDKRMQWSRDGADSILQIRSSKQSRDWKADWDVVQKGMYREAI